MRCNYLFRGVDLIFDHFMMSSRKVQRKISKPNFC